jgi:glycosyltransferase involved in cell wall biosynthesis
MCSKKIVYTGSFDPALCDGVSASFIDLFRYYKTLGNDTYIVSLMHASRGTSKNRKIIEKMGGEILYCDKSCINYMLYGVNIYHEELPYSRNEVLYSHPPEVLKKYIEKIKEFQGAFFFTTDTDLTALTAHVVVGSSFVHYVHSPSVFLNVLKSSSPMYTSFLKSRKNFTVNKLAQGKIKKELGISTLVWPPFINLDRFKFENAYRKKKTIGYYSAGPHKGDKIVRMLIKTMPDYYFVVMGNGSYSFSEYPNVSALGTESNLEKFYGKVSIILVPSKVDEGFPRIILEAAINGIPVIANRKGGIPDTMGESGIIVDANSDDNITASKYKDIIYSLVNDNNSYEQYRKKAYLRAEEYKKDIAELSSYYRDTLLGDL